LRPPPPAEAAEYRCDQLIQRRWAHRPKDLSRQSRIPHFQIKVDFCPNQIAPENLQLIDFPVGIEGDLVVGKREGNLLLGGEVGDPKNRYRLQACHPGSFHPAMANQDDPLFIDNNKAVESEFPDGGGDLTELLLRMPAGVAWVGLQLTDGQMSDMKITHLTPPIQKAKYITSIEYILIIHATSR